MSGKLSRQALPYGEEGRRVRPLHRVKSIERREQGAALRPERKGDIAIKGLGGMPMKDRHPAIPHRAAPAKGSCGGGINPIDAIAVQLRSPRDDLEKGTNVEGGP